MEAISNASRIVRTLFQVCYFYLQLGFVYLARWYEPALIKRGQYNHTIVVLGDDHALGVGGYTTIPGGSGITQKLGKEFAKEYSIRQTWQIYNRGEYHTSTDDWLLPADSKRKEKPDLLTKVLQDPKYTKAEIVIVMLGSYDTMQQNPLLTPEDTLRNLENICQALRKTGNDRKSIYLCTIPTAGDDSFLTEQQQADNLTRNRLIQEYIEKNNDNVLQGLQLDAANNFEFKRRNLFGQDGRHFSDIGYAKMAKDWVPLIRPDMVKREFSLFRSDLGL